MSVLEKILEEIESLHTKILRDKFAKQVTEQEIDALVKAKQIIRSHMNEGKDLNVPTNNWIPVSVRLPEDGEKVIVWYEYFRYGEYNCMFQTYGIGWQYDGHWSGDVSGTRARCIAWQPLPEPYKGGGA